MLSFRMHVLICGTGCCYHLHAGWLKPSKENTADASQQNVYLQQMLTDEQTITAMANIAVGPVSSASCPGKHPHLTSKEKASIKEWTAGVPAHPIPHHKDLRSV